MDWSSELFTTHIKEYFNNPPKLYLHNTWQDTVPTMYNETSNLPTQTVFLVVGTELFD